MKHQRTKDLYFSLAKPLAMLNHYRWRAQFAARPSSGPVMLNLGSGAKYLDGFINIEGGPKNRRDMWLDLRNGLPFPDRSVDFVYTSHVIEHLFLDEVRDLLSECSRVLRGGIRIAVPSMTSAIEAYVTKDEPWFPDWPHALNSLGGKLCNYLLCDGQHRLLFDFEFLSELLLEAGFDSIQETDVGKSNLFLAGEIESIESIDNLEFAKSLIVEARIPGLVCK